MRSDLVMLLARPEIDEAKKMRSKSIESVVFRLS